MSIQYNPDKTIQEQLVYQSTEFRHDREIKHYKPIQVKDRIFDISRSILTGTMSEYDARLVEEAEISFQIECMKVRIVECKPSELDETIKQIFLGKIPLPN